MFKSFTFGFVFVSLISQPIYAASQEFTASFTSDGKSIVESDMGYYRIYDSNGALKANIQADASYSHHFCNLEKSKVALTTGASVTLYDTAANSTVVVINPMAPMHSLACSSSGKFFLLGEDDGNIEVFSGTDGTLIRKLSIDVRYITELAVTPDDKKVAAIGDVGWQTIYSIDLNTGKSLSMIDLLDQNGLYDLPAGNSMQFSPDGRLLAWNFILDTGVNNIVFKPSAPNGGFFGQDYYYKFLSSQPIVIVVHADYNSGARDVTAYSTNDWSKIWSNPEYGVGVTNKVVFSSDGQFYAMGTLDGVKIYSTKNGQQVGKDIQVPVGGASPLTFSPADNSLGVKDGDRFSVIRQ